MQEADFAEGRAGSVIQIHGALTFLGKRSRVNKTGNRLWS